MNGHLDFVTDTHEQETTLSTVDGDLSDKLIEALGEEFLTEGADASLARLASLDRGVQLVLKIDDIDLGGGLR